MKVYLKRGKANYKENRLVQQLQKAIEQKVAENPAFADTFHPAENFDELKALHDKYCVEDATIIETEETTETNTSETNTQYNEQPSTMEQTTSNPEPYIDPLNREEPIVREYVMNEGFSNKEQPVNNTQKTVFNEPTSFGESFQMPDDSGQPTNLNSGNAKQNAPKPPKPEPVNPAFNDMGNAKKNRSTKRFAKYIVDAVCMLSEMGFVWYANKDINESKLAEYELNNEIDLSVLVSLSSGQQGTIKEFFTEQCQLAERAASINKEEREDLADALQAVLMEKGFGPTPTQELILMGLKIFGQQAIALMTIKAQTGGVLAQLRTMKGEQVPYQEVEPQPVKQEPPTQTQQAPVNNVQAQVAQQEEEEENPEEVIAKFVASTQQPVATEVPQQTQIFNTSPISEDESFIGTVIETKE